MHYLERLRIEEESDSMDRFMALREEEEYENGYQEWASDQRDNGEDDSREAYADHLDSLLPDYA